MVMRATEINLNNCDSKKTVTSGQRLLKKTLKSPIGQDFTISLHDGNHGNQMILEMLTGGSASHGKLYAYMSNYFIYSNK